MPETAVFDVVDKLVDVFAADATLVANSVLVVDGQPRNLFDAGLTLVVGGLDLADDSGRAASMSQEWANATTVERDERVSVHCALWLLRGDDDMRSARGELKTNLDAVSAALRANKATPSGATHILWWSLDRVDQLTQLRTKDEGILAAVTFTVGARCRIYL